MKISDDNVMDRRSKSKRPALATAQSLGYISRFLSFQHLEKLMCWKKGGVGTNGVLLFTNAPGRLLDL